MEKSKEKIEKNRKKNDEHSNRKIREFENSKMNKIRTECAKNRKSKTHSQNTLNAKPAIAMDSMNIPIFKKF